MSLPLYHRPKTILFLDDDVNYLESMALAMPENWCLQLYSRIDEFLDSVNQQSLAWEHDAQQHRLMITRWREGRSLAAQLLAYWAQNEQRYTLASAGVVDYVMPAMDGLRVLGKCPPWLAFRVLLTGKADERLALDAFNQGMIHRFITKQHHDLARHLIDTLARFQRAPVDSYDSLWQGTLSVQQGLVLRDAQVSAALADIITSNRWVEYVVLPAPFGILALDDSAKAYWLQLEMQTDLGSAAELAREAGIGVRHIAQIQQGLMLSHVEFLQEISPDAPPSAQPAIPLGSSSLLAAIFPLEHLGRIGVAYADILASRSLREIDASA